jgi:hypothetical protein
MVQLSKESIQEFKDLLEKKTGEEVTWADAEEAGRNLVNFYKVLLDCHWEEQKWKERLEKEPKGFKLSGNGRNCAVCGRSTTEDTNWYDKWGIKCLTCQSAIDKKLIPGSVARSRDNRYSPYELEDRFGIKTSTQRKWVKDGILKARIVPTENGRVHYYIFLIKDNKDFLPPKKLTDSHSVKEEREDGTWHRSEPWYRFVNPYEHLAGYKIMDYLQFVEQSDN